MALSSDFVALPRETESEKGKAFEAAYPTLRKNKIEAVG
jgi:hypothetical protein